MSNQHSWKDTGNHRGSAIYKCTKCGALGDGGSTSETCEESLARRKRNKEYWEYKRLKAEMPEKIRRYEYLKAKYEGSTTTP